MFAIVNADIETVTKGRIANGSILVDNGKILAVGREISIPAEAERINAGGYPVTPGLIEAHSHAGMAEDGFPHDGDYNESSDPVTPHLLALDGFKPSDISMSEAAAAGVTTMYLTQGSANVIGGIGAVVKTWGSSFSDRIVNPEAGMKMAMGENPKRIYGEKDKAPRTRMGIASLLRQSFTDARNYMARKTYRTGRISAGMEEEPFAEDLKMEMLVRLLKGDFPARCHAHRAVDMLTFMRIADAFGFRYVFEHATECSDILEELKARQVPLVIGPSDLGRTKVELHHKTFATVAAAVAAGLTVAITSDHNVTPMKNLTIFAALAIREGLSAEDALKVLTINPARILGIEDRLGSIEAGKDADLVIWNGDPLDVRCKPTHVFFGGRLFHPGSSRF